MSLQNALFWFTGALFFVVQLLILLDLLKQTRSSDLPRAEQGRVEVIWTLVPASLIAALALMLGGLTQGSWTDPDASPRAGLSLRWTGPETNPAGPQ